MPAVSPTMPGGVAHGSHLGPHPKPDEVNLILGQSHFIKTVEDLHEALVGAVPDIKFGLAFCEASGPALVRWSGTDELLTDLARREMLELGAGHAFLILLRNAFPINVLPGGAGGPGGVRHLLRHRQPGGGHRRRRPATAGPSSGSSTGRAAAAIENEAEIAERKAMLRRFGYKAG